MPKMRHPKSKQAIEPDADQVQMYESQGWHLAPAKKSSAQPTTPATVAKDKE